MTEISLKPWRNFTAKKDQAVIKNWLHTVREKSQKVFERGINGPHNGAVARRKNGEIFLRSTPGQFPARDSGRLLASIKTAQTTTEAVIGTNVEYAQYLRTGTRKMARRKMSDHALRIGAEQSIGASKGWVKWTRSKL